MAPVTSTTKGNMSQPRTGLLIVGHGTRSERGRAEFTELAHLVAGLTRQTPVAACYLELAEPTIAGGIAELAALGVQRIVVLPLLLFAAGHAKEDIPAAVSAVARQFPHIDFTFAAHLGCHERLLRLSGERFEAAYAGHEEVAAQDTVWLMVGRGNRDASAQAEMQQFVEHRLRLTPVGHVRVAYLAMAEPALATVLPEIAELRYRRVVVQPHLLFHGELSTTVESEVARMAALWPRQQWLVASYLGVADLLAEAVHERFLAAVLRSPEP